MSREQLQDLVKDVRRLLAAGTAAIAEDRGLRQREQALQALAAKVPALAGVAQAVGRVRQAPPPRAAAPLCELLVLARQLAASLASAGRDGPLAAVEESGPWQTALAVRDADTWAAASIVPYTNEYKALMGEAAARPDLTDLRLIEPFLKKLTAPQGYDNGDALTDRLLPAYGSALLPDLRRDLSLKGGVAQARRLRAICAIDPRAGADLFRQALAEGSTAVKAQALRSLARLAPAEAERAALQLLASKVPWDVAHAALNALGNSRADGALDALVRGLLADEYQGLVEDLLAKLPHPGTTARLLEVLAELLKSEAEAEASRRKRGLPPVKGKKAQPAAPTGQDLRDQIMRLTGTLGQRKDAAAVPALVALLDHKNADVREAALGALTALGDLKGLRAAADHLDDAKVWEAAARAAWRLPARERYDRLAPLVQELSKPKKSEHRRGKFVLDLFEEEFSGGDEYFDDDDEEEVVAEPAARRTDWDPRWAPLLRKHLNGPYRPDAALGLAAVVGEKAIPDLLPLLVPSVKKNECGVVEALGYLKARAALPAMVPLMPGQPVHHYCIHDALRRINDPAAIPLLEGVLAKTKDRYRRDRIADVIEYLEKHRAEA